MVKFIAGFVVGIATAAAVSAFAAQLVGDDGYLAGWSVTVGGEEVCADPYVWTSTREIECD